MREDRATVCIEHEADYWHTPPHEVHLPLHEVHVWLASLDLAPALVERYALALSEDEKSRATRFRFARDQRRFIVSHGILRLLVGRYLHMEPLAVCFAQGAYGKPFLQMTAQTLTPRLSFNMSHAYEIALYVFSSHDEVGVDVEYVLRPMPDALEIAQDFFSVKTQQALRMLEGEIRQQHFFRSWTRYEAYLKARGVGLAGAEQEDARMVTESDRVVDHAGISWQVRAVPHIVNYCASLVLPQGDQRVLYWQWNV